jgi:pyruvate/2-oxoglutarate dehydrogenase complex dihydrolipoamide dehydrogenase (E3) component
MDVDVIVIGAGQAGDPLAKRFAASGKDVLLVERSLIGGTCINYGCTPSKTMIASARAAHVARTAGRLGVHAGEVQVDLAAVVDRKDAVVREYRTRLEGALAKIGPRLRVVHGHARFVSEREIEVAGARHRAETVILDVGARAVVPRLPGIEDVPWLDNVRAMDLRELPGHLLVLGGGYIGCELGQAFRRFGARVTVVDHNRHLLAREDEEVSTSLEAVFRADGIGLELGVEVEAVSGSRDGVTLRLRGGRELRGTHLLVATGRRPNTDDLGCEAAGIRLDPKGFIIVDDRYRTSARGVYAVGDVAGGPQFTHSTWDDHRLLFDLLTGRGTRGRSDRIIPYTVFTDPQVARVGLSERAARAQGVAHEVARMDFAEIARARETDEQAGLLKVLVDPGNERILGATIMGAEAGELIHVFAVLMRAGITARPIVEGEFIHPTFSEGLQSLVLRLPRYALG